MGKQPIELSVKRFVSNVECLKNSKQQKNLI